MLGFMKDLITRPTGRSMTPNYLGNRLGQHLTTGLTKPEPGATPMGRPIGSLDRRPRGQR